MEPERKVIEILQEKCPDAKLTLSQSEPMSEACIVPCLCIFSQEAGSKGLALGVLTELPETRFSRTLWAALKQCLQYILRAVGF